MLCVQTNLDEPAKPLDDPSLGLTSGAIASRSLKAEVNLLRLPLFALHTKGLSTLDGLECQGWFAVTAPCRNTSSASAAIRICSTPARSHEKFTLPF